MQLDATTTADPSAAWVFVLDGAGSGTGTFEGKIASPDGKYKLGWYRTEPAESPVAATVRDSTKADAIIELTNGGTVVGVHEP